MNIAMALAAPCPRCGGQFHRTYGELTCLHCGHPPPTEPNAARCHECGGKVAPDRALCDACAAALWKPRIREKAKIPAKGPFCRRRVK